MICCIGLKNPGGKIPSRSQSNTGASLSNFSITLISNSLAQIWRKKKLNLASTRQIFSGTKASHHHRHYPLKPYVVVMTLESLYFQHFPVHTPHPVGCEPIKEIQTLLHP